MSETSDDVANEARDVATVAFATVVSASKELAVQVGENAKQIAANRESSATNFQLIQEVKRHNWWMGFAQTVCWVVLAAMLILCALFLPEWFRQQIENVRAEAPRYQIVRPVVDQDTSERGRLEVESRE